MNSLQINIYFIRYYGWQTIKFTTLLLILNWAIVLHKVSKQKNDNFLSNYLLPQHFLKQYSFVYNILDTVILLCKTPIFIVFK